MAKIQDVARAADVSVSTVARAFRQDVSINDSTRQLVLSTAKKMGYYPNLLARGLKNSRTNMVGIVGNIDNPFYIDIINAIETELQKYGYQLLVGATVHSLEREANYLELMAGSLVSGVILTPFLEADAYVDLLCKRNIPVVQLFRKPYDFLDSVLIDDENGAFLAVNALLDKGHTRILLFDVPVSHASQRADGYRKAFAARGLAMDEALVVITSDDDIPATMERMKPTAVVTGVYQQGKRVFQYIKKNRLKLPGDLSVIMFDNVEWMEMLDIDAIAQPVDYVGVSATRLLMERIQGSEREPMSMMLQSRYVKRASVGAPM